MLKWSHCTGHSAGKHKRLMLGHPSKINDLTPALGAPVYLCWAQGILEDYSWHSQWCLQYPHLYLFLALPPVPDCSGILLLCQSLLWNLMWKSCNRTEFKELLWFEGSKSYLVTLLQFCLQQDSNTKSEEETGQVLSYHFSLPLGREKRVKTKF